MLKRPSETRPRRRFTVCTPRGLADHAIFSPLSAWTGCSVSCPSLGVERPSVRPWYASGKPAGFRDAPRSGGDRAINSPS
jgi:hypothetical protein